MLHLLESTDVSRGVKFRATHADGHIEEKRFAASFFKPTKSPGAPAIALAYRLESSGWKVIEARPTTSEACESLGVGALAAAARAH